jgi:integrase
MFWVTFWVTKWGTFMSSATYIFARENRWYFIRRVPKPLKEFDKRSYVKIALNTDSRTAAATKAKAMNAEIESYWHKLVMAGERHADKAFHQAIEFSRQIGFTYLPHRQLIEERPYPELSQRLQEVEKAGYNQRHVEALLGGVDQPKMKLSSCMDVFFDITKDRIIGKDTNQIRKWRNPKSRVLRDFIAVVGDKYVHELTRDHTFKYRDWWISRINEFSYVPESANKDFTHLKDIIGTVATHHQIKLDKQHLFDKIFLAEDNEQKRLPFDTDYIINVLLTENSYSDLTDDEKYILMAMADTGARDAEIVDLREDTIILDHPIPHIFIKKGKTQYSKRKIPLVGYALEAFKERPHGFPSYYGKVDQLSTNLNKSLRSRGLFPTEKHSLYSLRHSFQDRLTAADVKERLDIELMGHRMSREKYGSGATLEQKLKVMQEIALKKE